MRKGTLNTLFSGITFLLFVKYVIEVYRETDYCIKLKMYYAISKQQQQIKTVILVIEFEKRYIENLFNIIEIFKAK